MPRYFFRATFTSAVEEYTMVCVQWIHFIEDERNENTFIGRIHIDHWKQWPGEIPHGVNTFIWTTTLKPSRYALAYTEITTGMVFVELAFIPLDSENLNESNDDSFYFDFGDNKFPYYLGNSNNKIRQDIYFDEHDIGDNNENKTDFEILGSYVPTSILNYLT